MFHYKYYGLSDCVHDNLKRLLSKKADKLGCISVLCYFFLRTVGGRMMIIAPTLLLRANITNINNEHIILPLS